MKIYPHKSFSILENEYGEWNVCKEIHKKGQEDATYEMVDSKASFKTLFEAQQYIDNFPALEEAIINVYAKRHE